MAGHGQKAAVRSQRLALRLGIFFLFPIAAALAGAEQAQLLCCVSLTVLAALYEVSLVMRVCPIGKVATKVPFLARCCFLAFLDVQICMWMAEEVIPIIGGVPTPISTISVVLPCANETHFVKRTVQSVFEATPPDRLREIIIVDDASRPGVMELLGGADQLAQWRVHIIRHDVGQGLIRTKIDGGNAAQGDAVVFLDCHVKPITGWTDAILKNLRENPKRVVVPTISTLDTETWTEVSPNGGTKMCLSWRADFFWCNGYPGHEVPIASGGLLGMTTYWWRESGGYDPDMRAWGGENLDQSLRTWLCGGEIREAVGSRVAHMWRNPSNPETQLHYSIPSDEVRRNRLRASVAWLGPWAAKVRSFPEFEDFREGGPLSIGSLEGYEAYKSKLGCRGFDWYIDKFRHLFLDTGIIPEKIFHIKERTTGLCLQLLMRHGKPGPLALMPCAEDCKLQRFHLSNQELLRGKCCSGLKVWDEDACVVVPADEDAAVGQAACNLFGGGVPQHVQILENGRLKGGAHALCLAPNATEKSEGPRDGMKGKASRVEMHTCVGMKEGQEFQKIEERSDGSFKLRESRLDACLAPAPGREGAKLYLSLQPCGNSLPEGQPLLDQDRDQEDLELRWIVDTGGHLRHLGRQRCLDANNGVLPILYPCYPPGQNPEQVFSLLEDGRIFHPGSFEDNGRLQYPPRCMDAKPAKPITLQTVACNTHQAAEVHWEALWHEVPLEMELYKKAVQQRDFLGRPT